MLGFSLQVWGRNMNWSNELRAFRARTGLKQETLADLLKISQAYVSRLEAGRTEPKPGLENRIRALMSDRSHRDVIDFVLASVRVSPQIICVIQPSYDNVRYVALSNGFRNHPQFSGVTEGLEVKRDAFEHGHRIVRDILNCGVFNGKVRSVDVVWTNVLDGQVQYWRAINTPVRAKDGDWYLMCAMTQLNEDEYAERLTHREDPLIVNHIH